MVDRITPATTAEDIEALATTLGVRDEAAVFGEPFRQWVIEDLFAGPRPPWDLAGAEFVVDAEPYEHIKMRLLNAAQSTFSHWGALVGFEFSHQAAADGVSRALSSACFSAKPARLCRKSRAWRPIVILRPRCPASAIAPSATAAIRSAPMVRRKSRSGCWRRCGRAGRAARPRPISNAPSPAGSPMLQRRAALRRALDSQRSLRCGDRSPAPNAPEASIDLAEAALSLSDIFGDDLRDAPFTERVAGHLQGLLGRDAHGYLGGVLARG